MADLLFRCRRHFYRLELRVDLLAGDRAQQAGDDDAVVGLQPALDHPQFAVDRAGLNLALLDDAVSNARRVIDAARPDLDESVRAAIAPQIGIGAVKYADLSVAHDSEYVFDLDRMLALTGNTGPYLQYAAARIRSIFRSAALDVDGPPRRIVVREPGERALALALLEFGSVVTQVGDALEPHRLCGYLFDLAQTFSSFYESCPVLKAESTGLRESRLGLCALTLRVLVQGLDLLGVESPEQM